MNNKIKELRKEQGLTQKELAEKSGVARTIINQLETGKKELITVNTMIKLSDALDKSVSEIFLL